LADKVYPLKNLNVKNLVVTGFVLILSGVYSFSYSQKKPDQSLQKGGVKLEYKYPAAKSVKYLSDTKVVQDMDVNG
jgi:hypothetical protein